MDKNVKWKLISLVITLCFNLPIWFFILYSLMKSTNQDRLVWFLFIAYIPISIITQVVLEIAKRGD